MTKNADGRKDDNGKPDWTLLPMQLVDSVARVMTFGVKKYGRDNWKQVDDGERRYLAAAYRHLSTLQSTEFNDPETKEPHYAHAICSLIFAWWHATISPKECCSEEKRRAQDDGPRYE